MNKSWFYLGVMCILSMVITSCGDKPPTPAASPSTNASPVASPPAAAVPPTAPTTTTTPKVATTPPTVPAKSTATKSVSVDVAAGLIAPTNGDNWAKTVSKGRSDPFAMIALQPIGTADNKDPFSQIDKSQRRTIATSPEVAGKASGRNTTFSRSSSAIKSGVNKPLPAIKISSNALPKDSIVTQQPQKPTKGLTGLKKGKIASNGYRSAGSPEPGYTRPGTGYLKDHNLPISAIPRSGINKALPKIINELPSAKPEQAAAMEVSGVIEVSGKTQVIVKLPSESFSRYVEVGDRIANGKVLVKRVEGQNSLSPTVVLEEVGIEVPRKIGDKVAPASRDSQSK
jgi:hypothetical protein